jgi:hypothetical protein
MSEFLYIYRGGSAPSSPEQMQQRLEKWVAWFKDLGEKGHLKAPGQPLEPTGKVVSGSQKVITDGPFAETKDLVGGYSLIEATDANQAAELAKGCPLLEVSGAVEVRPIRLMNM